MKLVKILLIYFFVGLLLNSCKKDSTAVTLVGNWVKRSEFNGPVRSEAIAFTVGSKSYIGLGMSFDSKTRLTDFWEYDVVSDYWTQKADFTGPARTSATAFATDLKGYVATGYDGTNYLFDTYEYNPSGNLWKKMASLFDTIVSIDPNTQNTIISYKEAGRYDAVSFGLNNKGYLGTGFDGNYLKDFWRFDPTVGDSGKWSRIASIGGSKRTGATSFVINGKGYVCCGVSNGSYVSDFWTFDPATESWSILRPIKNISTETYDDAYTSIVREYGVAFIIDSKAYVTAGINGSIVTATWEYDPATDLWTQKTSFEGTPRYGTVAFTVSNRGYIATGRSSNYRFDDCWEFKPNDAVNTNDNGD